MTTGPRRAPPGRAQPRFEFGRNWRRYLEELDEERIAAAEASLAAMLSPDGLHGKRFLDVGCGSGLFSLAARRLGAAVRSFDFDAESVACAEDLRRRLGPPGADWVVERGSILDEVYLRGLGRFDFVYAWGVLHHTGSMWRALENCARLVDRGGRLCVALYNDQGWRTAAWRAVKRLYVALPAALRPALLAACFARIWGPTFVKDLLRGRPGAAWRSYGSARGMSPWRDVVDWVGGYPFEAARPGDVVEFARTLGLDPLRVKTVGGGYGCNEFLFTRSR